MKNLERFPRSFCLIINEEDIENEKDSTKRQKSKKKILRPTINCALKKVKRFH